MKTLYFVLCVCVCVVSAGCTNTIYPEWYQWAEDACSVNGGLKEFEITGPFNPVAKCENGANFKASSKDLVRSESSAQQ
jgi:hypothetical protein